MKKFIKEINFKLLSCVFAGFLLFVLLCVSILSILLTSKTEQSPIAKKVSADSVYASSEQEFDINSFLDAEIELTLKPNTSGFKLEYTAVPNSTEYEIYRKIKDEKGFTLIGTTQKNKYIDKTVITGNIYIYKVRAVIKQKEGQLEGEFSNKVKKKYVWFDKNKKMVALTFDDGPGKYTNKILKCLDKYDAHATFFVLGCQVKDFKSAVKKEDLIGCEIGSHTYDHLNLTVLSKKGIKNQVNKTDKLIKSLIGHKATLLRPPYGAVNSTVKKVIKKPIVTWDVDTRDWATKSASKTYDNIIKSVSDGDIILMHDIYSSTKNAVLKIIPALKKKGYQLVTVSELAEYKGIKLKNGEVYREIN